jgi:hypothetical protein
MRSCRRCGCARVGMLVYYCTKQFANVQQCLTTHGFGTVCVTVHGVHTYIASAHAQRICTLQQQRYSYDYTQAARYTTATAITTCCSQELQVLDLSYNDFTELPVSSGLLTLRNLKQLHLDYNSLNSLPSTLSDSPAGASLKVLGLQCNALEAVPEVLFKLPKLKVLRLGGNAIAANQMRTSEFLALEQLVHAGLFSTCEL